MSSISDPRKRRLEMTAPTVIPEQVDRCTPASGTVHSTKSEAVNASAPPVTSSAKQFSTRPMRDSEVYMSTNASRYLPLEHLRRASSVFAQMFCDEARNARRQRLVKQRTDFGKGHGVKNDINELTKRGIAALKYGRLDEARDAWEAIEKQRRDFAELSLTPKHRQEFEDMFLPEVVEFERTFAFVDYVIRGTDPESILALTGISDQQELFGDADVPSEVSKVCRSFVTAYRNELSNEHKAEIRDRLLLLVEGYILYLDSFSDIPDNVLNIGGRGWMNTYRGKIQKLEELPDKIEKDFDRLMG